MLAVRGILLSGLDRRAYVAVIEVPLPDAIQQAWRRSCFRWKTTWLMKMDPDAAFIGPFIPNCL